MREAAGRRILDMLESGALPAPIALSLGEGHIPLQVYSESDSSIGENSEGDLESLENAAFALLLREKVSRTAYAQLPTLWDHGLSPEPLYSYTHRDTRCRHWATVCDSPSGFLCATTPSTKHVGGGERFMDPSANVCVCVCRMCVKAARAYNGWAAYEASYLPPQE